MRKSEFDAVSFRLFLLDCSRVQLCILLPSTSIDTAATRFDDGKVVRRP